MTTASATAPRPKRRALRLAVFVLIAAGVLYVGIHGALRSWAIQGELQHRLICASNLKALGTSSKLYAEAWDGTTPIIDWLVQTSQVTVEQTKCPGAESPNYVVVILPALKKGEALDNRTVIAYEPKSNHNGEGGNILFADGHASFVRVPAYDELIAVIPRREP